MRRGCRIEQLDRLAMLIGYTLVTNMSIKTSTILCLVLSVMLFRYGSSLRANRPPTDLDFSASPMRPYLEAFSLDRGNLMRYYAVDLTPDAPTG